MSYAAATGWENGSPLSGSSVSLMPVGSWLAKLISDRQTAESFYGSAHEDIALKLTPQKDDPNPGPNNWGALDRGEKKLSLDFDNLTAKYNGFLVATASPKDSANKVARTLLMTSPGWKGFSDLKTEVGFLSNTAGKDSSGNEQMALIMATNNVIGDLNNMRDLWAHRGMDITQQYKPQNVETRDPTLKFMDQLGMTEAPLAMMAGTKLLEMVGGKNAMTNQMKHDEGDMVNVFQDIPVLGRVVPVALDALKDKGINLYDDYKISDKNAGKGLLGGIFGALADALNLVLKAFGINVTAEELEQIVIAVGFGIVLFWVVLPAVSEIKTIME